MNTKVMFENIAGMEEVKQELREVGDFLLNPEKYQRYGARLPKGILFYGPPGTGKTMMAKALANETQSSFIYAGGSEFIEKFVGVGAGRIRALFDRAEKKRPCIVFIDEIDAIGVCRNTDSNSERDQTLNQLLIELDGFKSGCGVVTVAATNRIDMLDKALLRPGRFDKQIYIGNPPLKAREKIISNHLKGKPVSKDVDIEVLSQKTNGLSGAHIANIVNEAALISVRKRKKHITNEELNDAFIKVTAGLKNNNMLLSEREKKQVAVHEAGHTLMQVLLKNIIPEQTTIIPHGEALGFVLSGGSKHENFLLDICDIQAEICIMLAGRASEELLLNKITTGARDDLKKANEVASAMVCEYGMSEKYRNRTFERDSEMFFMNDLNSEISSIITDCYKRTTSLLNENLFTLKKLAEYLYKDEILKKDDIAGIINVRPSVI